MSNDILRVNDLTVGSKVTGFLAVREASIRSGQNGSPFLVLTLTDGSELIPGRKWDHQDQFCPKTGSVVTIDGLVTEYNGAKQITVNNLRPADPGEVPPAAFLPPCPKDVHGLYFDLQALITEITDPALRDGVTQAIEQNMPAFIEAPAAVIHHHAHLGGLILHTLDVARKALAMAECDPRINRDMVIAGALLHDIGKIHAYDWSGAVIERSNQGRCIEHVGLGLMILAPLVAELDPLVRDQLLHVVASHQNKQEWGALVEPATPEAQVVSLADLADAKLFKMFGAQVEDDTGWGFVKGLGPVWTGKIKRQEREEE